MTRRGVLKTGAGLALGRALAPSETVAATRSPTVNPDVYEALRIKHVINATDTVTAVGGSLMPPKSWDEKRVKTSQPRG